MSMTLSVPTPTALLAVARLAACAAGDYALLNVARRHDANRSAGDAAREDDRQRDQGKSGDHALIVRHAMPPRKPVAVS